MSNNWQDNEEIKILQEYLRIPSVHPNIDYGNFIRDKKDFNFTEHFFFRAMRGIFKASSGIIRSSV